MVLVVGGHYLICAQRKRDGQFDFLGNPCAAIVVARIEGGGLTVLGQARHPRGAVVAEDGGIAQCGTVVLVGFGGGNANPRVFLSAFHVNGAAPYVDPSFALLNGHEHLLTIVVARGHTHRHDAVRLGSKGWFVIGHGRPCQTICARQKFPIVQCLQASSAASQEGRWCQTAAQGCPCEAVRGTEDLVVGIERKEFAVLSMLYRLGQEVGKGLGGPFRLRRHGLCGIRDAHSLGFCALQAVEGQDAVLGHGAQVGHAAKQLVGLGHPLPIHAVALLLVNEHADLVRAFRNAVCSKYGHHARQAEVGAVGRYEGRISARCERANHIAARGIDGAEGHLRNVGAVGQGVAVPDASVAVVARALEVVNAHRIERTRHGHAVGAVLACCILREQIAVERTECQVGDDAIASHCRVNIVVIEASQLSEGHQETQQ